MWTCRSSAQASKFVTGSFNEREICDVLLSAEFCSISDKNQKLLIHGFKIASWPEWHYQFWCRYHNWNFQSLRHLAQMMSSSALKTNSSYQILNLFGVETHLLFENAATLPAEKEKSTVKGANFMFSRFPMGHNIFPLLAHSILFLRESLLCFFKFRHRNFSSLDVKRLFNANCLLSIKAKCWKVAAQSGVSVVKVVQHPLSCREKSIKSIEIRKCVVVVRVRRRKKKHSEAKLNFYVSAINLWCKNWESTFVLLVLCVRIICNYGEEYQ